LSSIVNTSLIAGVPLAVT